MVVHLKLANKFYGRCLYTFFIIYFYINNYLITKVIYKYSESTYLFHCIQKGYYTQQPITVMIQRFGGRGHFETTDLPNLEEELSV